MMQIQKVARLQKIARIASEREQAKMARLTARSVALARQLTDLEAQIAARARALPDDLALQAGADLVWQRWIDVRKIAINAERARLAYQIAEERQHLARALGRAQVTEKMAQRVAPPPRYSG